MGSQKGLASFRSTRPCMGRDSIGKFIRSVDGNGGYGLRIVVTAENGGPDHAGSKEERVSWIFFSGKWEIGPGGTWRDGGGRNLARGHGGS